MPTKTAVSAAAPAAPQPCADARKVKKSRRLRTDEEDVTVCVQFKWGRTATFSGGKKAWAVGDVVIVRLSAEGEGTGLDVGMVAWAKPAVQAKGAKVVGTVKRVARPEEAKKWGKELVAKETAARDLAAAVLPENATNIRVLHCSYRFDEKALALFYSPSGVPNLKPSLPKLKKAFPSKAIDLIPFETPEAEPAQYFATPPTHQSYPPLPPPTNNFALGRPQHAREQSMDSVFSS